MSDEEEIRELYRRYWQYMIYKNVYGLSRLQSDSYG